MHFRPEEGVVLREAQYRHSQGVDEPEVMVRQVQVPCPIVRQILSNS